MRKTIRVTISGDPDNRDNRKIFEITEMSAVAAEAWGIRAMGAMAKGGIQIPEEIMNAGMAGFAAYGIASLLAAPWETTKPLLDEMMACVQIVEPAITRGVLDSDIEEISTRLKLRDEVLKLHLGFSIAATLSLAMAARLAASKLTAPEETTGKSPTSRRRSRRSSPAS